MGRLCNAAVTVADSPDARCNRGSCGLLDETWSDGKSEWRLDMSVLEGLSTRRGSQFLSGTPTMRACLGGRQRAGRERRDFSGHRKTCA